VEALRATPRFDDFAWRIENALAPEGGFALITGEPGTGKSVALRLLADRLSRLREVRVGSLEHPQSQMADFYREMGDLFGVELRPHNRWAGFKALRESWLSHVESTLMRPVLLVDEAQEMHAKVLSELRILCSTRFDSRSLLAVVLAGDGRLEARLRQQDLLPLQTRIRTRLALEPLSSEELRESLEHLLEAAGNPALMTSELKNALCEHALGNLRSLCLMAAELLAVGTQREVEQLDEKLFLEVYQPATPRASRRPKPKSRR
jgi:type II secretory pathway predicted ATPase ExeA